jgi:hypothetical protein
MLFAGKGLRMLADEVGCELGVTGIEKSAQIALLAVLRRRGMGSATPKITPCDRVLQLRTEPLPGGVLHYAKPRLHNRLSRVSARSYHAECGGCATG